MTRALLTAIGILAWLVWRACDHVTAHLEHVRRVTRSAW